MQLLLKNINIYLSEMRPCSNEARGKKNNKRKWFFTDSSSLFNYARFEDTSKRQEALREGEKKHRIKWEQHNGIQAHKTNNNYNSRHKLWIKPKATTITAITVTKNAKQMANFSKITGNCALPPTLGPKHLRSHFSCHFCAPRHRLPRLQLLRLLFLRHLTFAWCHTLYKTSCSGGGE